MPENNEKNAPKPGIVYVLTNPAYEGLVKIGMTTLPLRTRLNALNSPSGIPRPFEVYRAVKVEDPRGVEQLLHATFSGQRVRKEREFFKIAPKQATAALELTFKTAIQDVTPVATGKTKDDIEAREKQARRRAKNFRFDDLGITVGAVLTFLKKPKLKATVVDDKNKVEFEGEQMTVSRAATKVLGTTYGVNGTYYWEYRGEVLDDIRTRKEREAKTKTRMTRR